MDGNTEYVITKLHGESDRSLGGQYPGMDWLHFEIERGQKKRCSSQGWSSAEDVPRVVESFQRRLGLCYYAATCVAAD